MYRKWIALRNELIFEAADWNVASRADAAAIRFQRELEASHSGETAQLLKEIAIDLQSYLPQWSMPSVSKFLLKNKSEKFLNLLEKHGFGQLAEDARAEIDTFSSSRWIQLAEASANGELFNCWGNDNGLRTMEAMRRGASFVTTNPPIVNMARKERADVFDRVRDEINLKHAGETVDQRITRLTMQVVLNNCRALRPIYCLTNAREGYVNFQVSPKNYDNAEKMIEEIRFAYGELTNLLGGKPNVVFKVPGTRASLDVVRAVTAEGIGVNITVNFSVSQSQLFADAIECGRADKSFITVMAGRLDGPVGEELERAGVAQAKEIAKLASRLVTKRVYGELLVAKKYTRSEVLVASLRGPWNIAASITDHPASRVIISSFPDKAAEFDALGRGQLRMNMGDSIPAEDLASLKKSVLFNQAYDWGAMAADQFNTYPPVTATLNSFIAAYEELEAYVQ